MFATARTESTSPIPHGWLPVFRRVGLVLVVVALLAACSGESEVGAPAEDETATAAQSNYGPLAVLHDESTGSDEALGGRGLLRLTADCAWLETDDRGSVLLIWRSGDVQWQADEQSLLFAAGRGDLVLADGDSILVAGNDSPVGAGADWLAVPDESCIGTPFNVHDVTRLEDA